MSTLRVYLDGIGLCGPGMAGWQAAAAQLGGREPLSLGPTVIPVVEALPPAERRRVGASIKLAMAVGFETARHAQADPADLPVVFSSSGGDSDNCISILDALASEGRQISPTRFHNSVHNAPAGYWGIATGCRQPSTSLCALDGSFGAGLIEAATQIRCGAPACLVLAYEVSYPDPLYVLRQIEHPFGVGLLLRAERSAATLASLDIALGDFAVQPCRDATLESLRAAVPSARVLPLLEMLARGETGPTVLEYLPSLNVAVEVGA